MGSWMTYPNIDQLLIPFYHLKLQESENRAKEKQ